MKKNSGLVGEYAILILGLALFGLGLYFLKERLDFFKHSIQAEGIVIDIEKSGSRGSKGGSRYSYYPVISFQALDGNIYTFSPESGTNSYGEYLQGDKLTIMYNTENPQSAKIDSFWERWGIQLTFLIVGLAILLAQGGKIYNIFYTVRLRKELPITGSRLELPGRVELKSSRDKTEFFVVSDWLNPADAKIYVFTSDKIPYDPTVYITDRMMVVWIDRMKPKRKNYMDISFLPQMTQSS